MDEKLFQRFSQQQLRTAFWHLRCMYIEIHDKLPQRAEVVRMFAFMRPDMTDDEVQAIASEYYANYKGN